MAYSVEIFAASLESHDTESVTTKDLFAMAGSVLADGAVHGFLTREPMRIGRGETHDLGGYPTGPGHLFSGIVEDPRIGLIVRGYDIDNNRAWVENREDVDKVLKAIEKLTEDVPVLGTITKIAAKIPDIVDVFTDADGKDLVLAYAGWIDVEAGAPGVRVTRWHTIRTRRSDGVGYSSADYTLNIRVVAQTIAGSLGEVRHPRLRPARNSRPADWAGLWQSERVDCAITPAVSALGDDDVLTVEITERDAGQERTSRQRAVPINRPVLAEALAPPVDIPTSRQGDQEGLEEEPLIGSGTVEGRAAGGDPLGGLRTEVEGPAGSVTEGAVDVLDRAAAGRGTSKADYLSLDDDTVMELYQERLGGDVVGARIRYVRPAAAPVRDAGDRVDEMLTLRVV